MSISVLCCLYVACLASGACSTASLPLDANPLMSRMSRGAQGGGGGVTTIKHVRSLH